MLKSEFRKKTFPAMLLTEGKRALVIGGGKIATRKIKHIIESKMQVKVISPEISEELLLLSENEDIEISKREFLKSDINDQYLVFAATSDKTVNRDIINICKSSGILCCSSDGNWKDGDFITPAIFRDKELTLTVSTDGKACRKSRIIKNSLAHYAYSIEKADLYVLGTDYNCHSAESFSKFKSLLDDSKTRAQYIESIFGIHEFMFIDTCNRVEFYALVSNPEKLKKVLLRSLKFENLSDNSFYIKEGFEAFKHLSMLAAGLKSELPGEHHIVSQIKDALNLSINNEWGNGAIKEWIDTSFYISKQIRNMSDYKQTSLPETLISYIENKDNFAFNSISILGTGDIGTSLFRSISKRYPNKEIKWYYNSKKPTVNYKISNILPINSLSDNKINDDIVVVATSANSYIVNKENVIDNKNSKLIIDLSMPRNVDPEIERFNSITLLSLSELNKWYCDNINQLNFKRYDQIINENREQYEKIIQSFKER